MMHAAMGSDYFLGDHSTEQYLYRTQVLDWLADQDTRELTVNSTDIDSIVQRYILATLYFKTARERYPLVKQDSYTTNRRTWIGFQSKHGSSCK
jgi:hypothetical protein